MKRLLFLLGLYALVQMQALSQTPNFTLSGIVSDNATKDKIEYASIRVLSAKDSTYISGGSTNKNGQFSISLKPAKYIVRVSYLGYDDYIADINLNKNTSLGTILMREDAVQLREAVVETAAIEIMVKGDTVEYNADSYKVQEAAVVEDLLKKMPGVEIDDEGKITVNGKEIKKILLDGKEFFSDDPKVASKNLPAKMVDKLQVLDQKSDMSLMTGFDDGNEETVINLTVKKGMKEGLFGNGIAGYGSEERYEGATNVNYMRNNTQVSLIGGVNNTNNAGASDLSSAMFGDSGGGRGPRGLRFGGRNGVTKAITGGVNFATEHSEKLKWGGNVRYGNNDNDVMTNSITEYTTPINPRNEISNAWGNNKSESFATDLKFEWTPDKNTKLIFRPNVQYNTSDNLQGSTSETSFIEDASKDYTTNTNYFSDSKGYRINGNLDFSRKLNERGRVLSIGLRGGVNDTDNNGLDKTITKYISGNDSIIDQQFYQEDNSYNWRMFASFVEPLKNNNFLELSYNVSNNHSETDKNTYFNVNPQGVEPSYSELDSLYTRFVKNDFLNQNVSLKFRSQREKFNYTLGVGLEPSSSKTTLRAPSEMDRNQPRKNFLSFAPSGQFNYFWDKRHNLRVDYQGTTNQPSTLQLYDGIYSREGMNTTSGNPNLKPSFTNRLNIRYQKFNAEKASFVMLRGQFNHISNDIVSISTSNGIGGDDRTYRNISGNMNGNLRFIFNTPLRNRNWSVNSMSFASYAINNTFTDLLKNKAKTLALHENVGLQFRSDIFDFALRGNIRFNNIDNSISTRNNRSTYNYGGVYDFTLRMPNPFRGIAFVEHILSDLTLESDINYSANAGYGDGYKQNEWLWNASIAKQVFKNKAGTIRFKVYDILKERSNISQTDNASYNRTTITNSIPNYFMVNFVYRFQIFKGGAKQGDMNMGGARRHGRPPHA